MNRQPTHGFPILTEYLFKNYFKITLGKFSMKQRHALLVLVVLFAGLSGCNFGTQTETPTPAPETNTPDLTTDVSTQTDRPPVTEAETPHQFAPDDRLVIDKQYNGSVTVRVFDSQAAYNRSQSNEGSAQNVSPVRYPDERRDEIHVSAVEVDGYVVLETESGTVWESPIDPYTRYQLRIHEDGSIERTSLDFS